MTGGSLKKNLHDYKNNQLAGLSTQSTKCDLRWLMAAVKGSNPSSLPSCFHFIFLPEREEEVAAIVYQRSGAGNRHFCKMSARIEDHINII